MGYLKDVHGMTLLGNVPEGTCPECAEIKEHWTRALRERGVEV